MQRSVVLTPRVMEDLQGLRYIGAEVDSTSLADYLATLRNLVGTAKAAVLTDMKAQRDGRESYHLTLVSPPEFELLDDALSDIAGFDVVLLGLGRVRNDDAETYFVVAESQQVVNWRTEHGLPPRHLHITLGFFPHDIYDAPKDHGTLVYPSD